MVCNAIGGARRAAVCGEKIQLCQMAGEMAVIYPVLCSAIETHNAVIIERSRTAYSGKRDSGNANDLSRTGISASKNAAIRPRNVIHYVGQIVAYSGIRIDRGIPLNCNALCNVNAARP